MTDDERVRTAKPADASGPVPLMLELSWVFPAGFKPPPGPNWPTFI